MRKLILAASISGLVLTGCQGDTKGDIYGGASHINTDTRHSEIYGERDGKPPKKAPKSQQFGFNRHQKSPIMGDNHHDNHYAMLDREKLAGQISRIAAEMPNVNDVATLVTDEEVLIAYDTDTNNRELTADQVKLTAVSLVPRYFHVYVSDNKMLIRDVESLANMTTQANDSDEAVAAVIREMKKSPQGRKIDAGENANGESADDMNRSGMGK